ncbi:hypothetical protein [Streptomyces agglomeratus]|uniref:hypothetical protein n=1 Tax=Streptomyces agglomeratus TaxID=285458 RepID=UPI00114CF183|nr:hypothetical protein [Streptomyces agglomeratus]
MNAETGEITDITDVARFGWLRRGLVRQSKPAANLWRKRPDPTTGVERFRKTQDRCIRDSQPVWKLRQGDRRRKARNQWLRGLMNHFGPLAIWAGVAAIILITR